MSTDFDPEAELAEDEAAGTVTADETKESGEDSATETATETDEEKAAREKAEADEAAAKKEAAEAALKEAYDEFLGAVNAVLADENVDKATGVVPEGLLSGPRAAYLKLPAKGRKAASLYLTEKMQEELTEGEVGKARAYLAINRALQSAKAETIVREPVDPTEAYVLQVAAMRLAANFMSPPEGVAENWVDQVQALGKGAVESGDVAKYKEWLDANEGKTGDERTAEPTVQDVVKLAASLARGKGRVSKPRAPKGEGKAATPRVSTGDGQRRNVGEHIREAFESHDIDTFLTIAQIAEFKSKEYEGANPPSQGAISARLFPASGAATKLTFVRAEGPEQGRPQKGAVKIA